jgi:hypothetical protein
LRGKASDEKFLNTIIWSGGLSVIVDGLNEVTVRVLEEILPVQAQSTSEGRLSPERSVTYVSGRTSLLQFTQPGPEHADRR